MYIVATILDLGNAFDSELNMSNCIFMLVLASMKADKRPRILVLGFDAKK